MALLHATHQHPRPPLDRRAGRCPLLGGGLLLRLSLGGGRRRPVRAIAVLIDPVGEQVGGPRVGRSILVVAIPVRHPGPGLAEVIAVEVHALDEPIFRPVPVGVLIAVAGLPIVAVLVDSVVHGLVRPWRACGVGVVAVPDCVGQGLADARAVLRGKHHRRIPRRVAVPIAVGVPAVDHRKSEQFQPFVGALEDGHARLGESTRPTTVEGDVSVSGAQRPARRRVRVPVGIDVTHVEEVECSPVSERIKGLGEGSGAVS